MVSHLGWTTWQVPQMRTVVASLSPGGQSSCRTGRALQFYGRTKTTPYHVTIKPSSSPTFIPEPIHDLLVEHLDPELGPWSALEYQTIAEECREAGSRLLLSSVSPLLQLPEDLKGLKGLEASHENVEKLFADNKTRICLLDPKATEELNPRDADKFDGFLFGGILGDDPPRDRTSELRAKGFEGRRLGPVQMTTDTAVRVTRMVIQNQMPLQDIPYVDEPVLKFNKYESTTMPFRYVRDRNGEPLMPKGMRELIERDAEKGLDDLL
ncbi:MAG: hypothetical protein M1820_004849 [Bogoriella megaspora]|nr:MAG: hypothetical protein M1820_004849 [Bogoriella megaspora]